MKRPWLALAAPREPYLRPDETTTEEQSRRRDVGPLDTTSAGATQLHGNSTKRDDHADAENQEPAEAVEQQQRRSRQTFAPLLAA